MAFPTCSAIVAGIVATLETAHPTATVLDYEPATVDAAPLFYVLLAEGQPRKQGQQKEVRYRFLVRLCLNWQENERAEQELRGYVDSVMNAFDADPWLGGALTKGLAVVIEQFADYVPIAGITFRVLDSYIEVVAKGHSPLTP